MATTPEHMKYLLIPLLLLFSIQIFGQDKEFIATNNARKSMQIAQDLVNSGKLEKARKQLRHTTKLKKDFAVAYRVLGMVSLELGRYSEAIEAFESSFDLDEKLSRAAFFECGEAYFKSGDHEMATYYYTRYQELKDKSYANKQKEAGLEKDYELILAERGENCKYLAEMDTSNTQLIVQHLGDHINSKYDDYLPTITNDGTQLIYTRTAKNKNQNIYHSELKKGLWSKGKAFGRELNSSKNEGMAKFEAHGKAFYFAGCMREDTEGGCDIYEAQLLEGDVSEVTKVEGHLNSTYWDSQPSITCDGMTMYFSSNRQGGFGGADIWVSYLRDQNQWSVPENLGPAINTMGDEEAPYISNDGLTLYFSSNGHPGQGDGDLFLSRSIDRGWSKAENLGYPINSPAKELGIYVQADSETAYFSSARKGSSGGLDIFEVQLPQALQPAPIVQLEGLVVDKLTGAPIETKIKITRKEENWKVYSDLDGWFFLCLPGNQGYSFQIDETGYEYLIDAQFLASRDNTDPIKIELELQPDHVQQPELVAKSVQITEKRIQFFFDFNSFELTDKSITDLKALTQFLKKENKWKVEVVGYADAKGDSQYNLDLSKKRAKEIVEYLDYAGVNIGQVVKNEGKGALKNPSASDESQSRRVDVILRSW